VREAHGEAIVESLGEERRRPLRFDKAQQSISRTPRVPQAGAASGV
jgi:hypothetical protein